MIVRRPPTTLLLYCASAVAWMLLPSATAAQSHADPSLTAFIAKIRTVDNHSHANSVAPGDSDADALALDGVPLEVPVTLRPEHPAFLASYQALYKYPHADLSDAHMKELRATMQRVARREGDRFPTWILDQVGTEILLANRIAITVDAPPNLPPVTIDRTLFARALTNVIENALHAMPSGGRLSVTSRDSHNGHHPPSADAASQVVVEIADTGVGMDEEALRKIFEPYFSTKATGTGLGLTIAKRNVELIGGAIDVRSERGVGTTVTITLPAALG